MVVEVEVGSVVGSGAEGEPWIYRERERMMEGSPSLKREVLSFWTDEVVDEDNSL